ncbi:MAG: Peptidase family [Frankiales bacterium]|nr:Peptidase family [Frankiales bacterium]
MSSLLCLQGGAEFQPGCEAIDGALLRQLGAAPRVAVTALAGSPGADYARATANGVRWWADLGADAVAVPDARQEESGALDVLASADLVVLPGGSPARLRAALMDTGVGALLVARWEAGECAVAGASAGAMLLCSHTVLPDRRGKPVVSGLGLLRDALVLPHWSGHSDWVVAVLRQAPEGTRLLGLPERSGIIVDGDRWSAWGQQPSELVPGDLLALGEIRQMS